MRINKYLASLGIASRRKIDEMVEEGLIRINGKMPKLGDQIEPGKDKIEVNGQEIKSNERLAYIILNKPAGYTSTAAKIKGEKNVLELVKTNVRLYPVGRLDKDSTGLILLTNDGELTQKITHPKFHIPKTYEVLLLGNVSDTQLEMMRKGIKLEDGITKPADIVVIKKNPPNNTLIQMTLYEGKKRQIRRMTSALHLHIIDLKRTSIGPIKLSNIPLGKYRNLSQEEIKNLINYS
jgi:pseudouridine synthase